ncbi:MAG: hypothetical protein GX639_07590 [Fibrobacter sp.]|mgnify:CR=1 FL=1|nr:hypothetical protein [Fibrobacter sp.]
MPKSPLFERRIHITGSISDDNNIATAEEVNRARNLIKAIVIDLIKAGACFVVPIDAEKMRSDNLPKCFDWLIWDTINDNLHLRPSNATNPMIIAVKHHKNEVQIPEKYVGIWDRLRNSDLVQIENAAHWNMNSKRMEMQAQHGEILLTIGGGEGVLFLANLYHDAGKPVIPINLKLCTPNTGALRIFEFGLSGNNAQRLFRTENGTTPHNWLNRIDMTARKSVENQKQDIMNLLEALVPPTAFVVRLLNPEHSEYNDVQNFFDTVVQPVIETDLGFKLTVVDGNQPFEFAHIDQEIFTKLHRSSIVLADITGLRPNCLLELGYALGRGLPTLVLAKEGINPPFDITTFSGHHWKTNGSATERKNSFIAHYKAVINRPPLVPTEPLIP